MNSIAPASRPAVAIIGGGFSGAAFALHLLRDAPDLRVNLMMIEPGATLGAGLAYSTPDPDHRINVAAARMAVFAEDPAQFDRWFRAGGGPAQDPQSVGSGGTVYPSRAAFGRYVHEALANAAAASPAARMNHIRERAEAVTPDGGSWRVALSQGGSVRAETVVLATGHAAAEPPAALAALRGGPGLLADPWALHELRRVHSDARVVIVGTGLTMTDVLATLRGNGHRGPVAAVSRRGLLPRSRTALPVDPRGRFAEPPPANALALLHRIRAEVASGTRNGLPWEGVIDALRAQSRAVWGSLSPEERRRLLRHLQPFWDVHRYQCSPQIDALLRHELDSGGLRVIAGSLLSAERLKHGTVRVHLRRRGKPDSDRLSLSCDVVVNCTGPAHRLAMARNPALRSLAEAGLIRPDPYGLGIETDPHGRAIDASGRAAANLLVAGPPARAAWGELMGLPQVSTQPRELAALVAAQFQAFRFSSAQEADA